MRRVASSLVLLVALAAAGCDAGGQSDTDGRATPGADEVLRYPVAYKLRRSVARTLGDGDAWRLIEREGQVVATSEWEPYVAVVLTQWLHTREVEFDVPGDLQPAVDQDLPLLVISSEHRRYAERPTRLRPSESRLRAFYERFSETAMGTAGQAMRDWLRVVRLAVDETDRRHVVVIPLLD